MSNIPKARELLLEARNDPFVTRKAQALIDEALGLLDRRRPIDFTARKYLPSLSAEQRVEVKRLRSLGMSIQEVAIAVGTNSGRVSEVINPPRD